MCGVRGPGYDIPEKAKEESDATVGVGHHRRRSRAVLAVAVPASCCWPPTGGGSPRRTAVGPPVAPPRATVLIEQLLNFSSKDHPGLPAERVSDAPSSSRRGGVVVCGTGMARRNHRG